MPTDPHSDPSCSACSAVFKKKGSTSCWSSDPAAAPPRPGNCPTSHHGDLVASAMEQYRPGGPDERLARVAAEVEGLCVGHDMLFVKHADAPTTTLVAKDRVTGHNPAAALYGNHFYYKRLSRQPVTSPRESDRKG